MQAGARLGPYEIIAPIGAGGMGVVYRARDTRLGRDVAIKVLPAEFASDPDRLRRFEQEARAVAALDHPNILAIHDVGTHEGTPYLVSELLEGESLRTRLESGALPARKALGVAIQVASGLAAAHERGIVHRDLKPENLFITRDGLAKILDFGVAKLAPKREPAEPSVVPTIQGGTDPGIVMGTAGYMSPEQVRGQTVDHRSDIFSFGCVLYEMVTGRRAFARATAADTMAAILNEEPPEPSAIQAAVPAALSRVIAHCLEKRPEERFQSARDLAFELRAVLADTGAARAKPELTNRPGRRAAWLAAGGIAVILVAAGVFLALRGLTRTPETTLDPKRIVVAVFENQTGDRSLDPLGRMASDWITQGLSRVEGFEVVPSTSVLVAQPPGSPAPARRDPLQSLAEETGAGVVVSGSYYLQGQTLRIQAKVTDAVHGKLKYSLDPVNGPVTAPMEAIDGLRQRVMGAIAVSAAADLEFRELRPPLYDAYREFVAGFEVIGSDRTEALRHFQRAQELDPDFVTPRLFCVYFYHAMGNDAEAESTARYLEDRRQQLSPLGRCFLDVLRGFLEHRYLEALQAARDAEKLAPLDPLANHWAGYLAGFANHPQETVDTFARLERGYRMHHIFEEWRIQILTVAHHALGNYARELEVAQRGLEGFPDSLDLRASEAEAMAALGRVDDTKRVVEETLLLRPVRGRTPGEAALEVAEELRAHGHPDEAAAMAVRAIAWYRSLPSAETAKVNARADLGLALTLSGRTEEARSVYEKLAAEHPDDVKYRGSLGVLAAGRGDRPAAQRISEELRIIERPRLFGASTYQRARIAAILGERDRAAELLGQAFAQGLGFSLNIHRDTAFEGVRDYPPFREVVRPKG
jgi:tetratricopeptide (TPR) repeat protein